MNWVSVNCLSANRPGPHKQLLELGERAVDTIEKMDEEIEFKDKKIPHLEDKLKGLNQYDEAKVNEILNHTVKPSVKE